MVPTFCLHHTSIADTARLELDPYLSTARDALLRRPRHPCSGRNHVNLGDMRFALTRNGVRGSFIAWIHPSLNHTCPLEAARERKSRTTVRIARREGYTLTSGRKAAGSRCGLNSRSSSVTYPAIVPSENVTIKPSSPSRSTVSICIGSSIGKVYTEVESRAEPFCSLWAGSQVEALWASLQAPHERRRLMRVSEYAGSHDRSD